MPRPKIKYIRILLLINFIVAACYVVSCFGGHFKPWIFEFFVLGSFYFLVINLFFLLFWLFLRPPLALLSFAAMLICLIPMQHLIGFHSSVNKESKSLESFRILSWNVDRFDVMSNNHSSPLRAEMYELVRQQQPDLACFVEMVASKTDSKQMNYLPEMMNEMNMGNFHYVFDDDEFYIRNQQFGKLIISKFPIIHSGIHVWGNREYNYRLLFADIDRAGDTVRVFLLHLQSLRLNPQEKNITSISKEAVSERVKTSRGVIGKIKSGYIKRTGQADTIAATIAQSPYPVIVCGDFNDVPNSYAYTAIGSGLKNAFAAKGSGLGKSYVGIAPTLRIDNIFLSPAMKVISFQTLKRHLSDHYPLLADIQF